MEFDLNKKQILWILSFPQEVRQRQTVTFKQSSVVSTREKGDKESQIQYNLKCHLKIRKKKKLILKNLLDSMSLAFPSVQVVWFLKHGDYDTCEGSEVTVKYFS